jgi:hypothetical protein
VLLRDDPRALHVFLDGPVDGRLRQATFRRGRIRVALRGVAPGRHRLVARVSDYQETRNDENVARILPNTRRFTATFSVR